MVLSEYNPDWADQFESIRAILQNKLSVIVFKIEHVGSTSIKGLPAKQIIDIDLITPPNVSSELITKKLSELGYEHSADSVFEGKEIYFRSVDTVNNPVLDSIIHNLNAYPEDSLELERQILFRDYLRINQDGCIAYGKLKRKIAERAGQDVKNKIRQKKLRQENLFIQLLKKQEKQSGRFAVMFYLNTIQNGMNNSGR